MSRGVTRCSVIPLLPALLLPLLQAVTSVNTELVAVPVRSPTAAASAQTVTTPSMKTDTSESNARHSRPDVASARTPPLIRRPVAGPSSDFTTYLEGELVRVSIPSNWRELPGSNAVTFAPEGAYGNAGVKSVFTHGLGMGLARNDKRNLRMTTDAFIASYVLVNPSPGRTFHYRSVTIGDRPGLRTILSSVSEATGDPERIEIFTTLLGDGTLFYVLAVAPRNCVSDYVVTFRRVMGSIQIMDCDLCVLK
jgi:hypothetical protein